MKHEGRREGVESSLPWTPAGEEKGNDAGSTVIPSRLVPRLMLRVVFGSAFYVEVRESTKWCVISHCV